MKYFSFNGQSGATILDEPLILVSFDGGTDEITGSSREIVKGESGIYKYTANEYGVRYSDTLTFEYGLIKASGEPITKDEQIVIEKWLTSPKLSQYLQLFELECNELGELDLSHSTSCAIYCGSFVSTSWIAYKDGYAGVNFEFQCDQPYAWQFHDMSFSGITGTSSRTFNVFSDSTDDYVYPKITLRAINSNTSLTPFTIRIINTTDNNNKLDMEVLSGLTINMDCNALRLTDNAGGVLDYGDIGWEDVGNIYWPRLVHGNNTFSFVLPSYVTLNMSLSYMSPNKIVGGWL